MGFILPINAEKFRSTNGPWNNLMLNDPWSVGYVTTLIELVQFADKEEWEEFYYSSGEERNILISKLGSSEQILLQNELLIKDQKNTVTQMGHDLKNLNTQYGRTKSDLFKKAEILFENVKNNGLNLTPEECFECVRFRVICETWNGVILRERKTIETLKRNLPDADFKKVSGEIDYKYAVDYEVYKKGKLTSAIQIKPQSYTWNAPYIQKARNANRNKNQEYYSMFNVRVFNVIADSKGNIINPEVLKSL